MSERPHDPSDEPRGLSPRTPSDEPRGSSPRLILHALLLFTFLSLWTWKLLDSNPVPGEFQQKLERMGLAFVAAKGLHVCGYAFLTVLAVTLPAPRRWRWFLVGLLALHGVASEVGQTFVPNRTGRAWDVLIDWAGIALAVLAVGWLRGRCKSSGGAFRAEPEERQ